MDILELPFVGAYELRKNLPVLLRQLQEKRGELVVTQKGKPSGLLLSVKRYLELKMLNEELEEAIAELANKEYLKELLTAEKEIKAGKGKTAEKVFAESKV
jgi:prevent-host-death family protein